MGRGDPRGGRPPVDGRVQAAIYEAAAAHPDWGSRRIAAAAGCSRRTVQRYLGSGLDRARRDAYAAEQAAPVVGVTPGGLGPAERRSVALSAVLPMTDGDHRRFDEYRGAIYESPGIVWWTGR